MIRPMGVPQPRAAVMADALAAVIYGSAGAATVADERQDADPLAVIGQLPLKPLANQSMRELLTFAIACDQYEVEVIQSGLPDPAKQWVAYAADGEARVSAYGRTRREAVTRCLLALASSEGRAA